MQVNNVIKPGTDSFIGWLGGKTKLRSTIINCFPPHHCYVEVFAGSATVFFGKPTSRIEIINDIHSELINLMKVIAGTYFDESIRQEFIGYVRNMPAAREAYEDWKKWDKDQIAKLSPAQRAFRFYYCVKKGFSSVPKGGYEASPKTSSRYNMNTDFEKFADRFRASNAQIESLDFATLIEKYNRESADSFFFADPPYFIANNTNYYDFVFTNEDHLRFKACCDSIQKNSNKFLITYDDVPEVIDLYKGYHIYRTDEIVYNAADERGERELKKTELFISNYDIAKTILKRNKKTTKHGDMFAEDVVKVGDNRIEIADQYGLEKIN